MRFALSVLYLVGCIAIVPLPAQAQSSSNTAADFEDLPIPEWGKEFLGWFDEPVHPIIGGVASGGGIGGGVGYDSPDDRHWYREADAMITVRGYWALDGETGYRSKSERSQIGAFAGIRHMNRLDFYGLGPDSLESNRTDFRLRETVAGTRGWFRPWRPMRIGGFAAAYLPDLGSGSNRSEPPIQFVFPPATVPGLRAEPTFGRYHGFVEVIHPVVDPLASDDDLTGYRGAYQASIESNRDYDTGRFDFYRWDAEVQQRLPGIREGQTLTLHGFVSSINDDAEVPFYMLYTLGGGGGLKSFRPNLLGSDGTRATLRGFNNYRFRDRNLVLMQAEYRIPLLENVHSTVFVDSGQVAPRRSDLFDDLRTSTGFSLSYVHKGRSVARMDVGFGGGEGVQFFWSFGAFQN